MVLKPIARRASLAAVGALLLVPGLTACDQPEAAAVVGSQIISQDELADMTEQLSGLMAVV
ncbi:MAG: hypothetical protein LBU05_01675, partial [Bifidobacteriaceae bacterium]|nr:hypothetical protein [Bifidobacteriaceae bacterium]